METILFQEGSVVVTPALVRINGRTFPVSQITSLRVGSYNEHGRSTRRFYLYLSLTFLSIALVSLIAIGDGRSNSPIYIIFAGGLFIGGFLGIVTLLGWLLTTFLGAVFGRKGRYLTMDMTSGRPIALEGLGDEAISRAQNAIEKAMIGSRSQA